MWKRKKWNEFFRSKRFLRAAVITGLAAILLIFVSSKLDLNFFQRQPDADTYSEELKSRLLDIVSQIDGVGEVNVFLTMDNSGENVYLTNTDTKTKSIEPTVRGVVIVCEGGDNPVVVNRVLGAVTRSLSISSDKVYITKLDSRKSTVAE
ncbi:MAG: hypothetical protein IJ639_06500 [Ruminococcus sp.]|nr:hypothetical protein [Ruminococcus sp.]